MSQPIDLDSNTEGARARETLLLAASPSPLLLLRTVGPRAGRLEVSELKGSNKNQDSGTEDDKDEDRNMFGGQTVEDKYFNELGLVVLVLEKNRRLGLSLNRREPIKLILTRYSLTVAKQDGLSRAEVRLAQLEEEGDTNKKPLINRARDEQQFTQDIFNALNQDERDGSNPYFRAIRKIMLLLELQVIKKI